MFGATMPHKCSYVLVVLLQQQLARPANHAGNSVKLTGEEGHVCSGRAGVRAKGNKCNVNVLVREPSW